MDLKRAKEILAAEKDIPVHYHGVPVLIDSVDESSRMALVSERGVHDEKRLVSIDGLEEQ